MNKGEDLTADLVENSITERGLQYIKKILQEESFARKIMSPKEVCSKVGQACLACRHKLFHTINGICPKVLEPRKTI